MNALGGYSTHQNNPQRTTYCGSGEYSRFNDRNRGGKPKYQQNRRVAYIYENENGDSVIESESATNSRVNMTPQAARATKEDGKEGKAAGEEGHVIHALPEGVDKGDFIPLPFLGGI